MAAPLQQLWKERAAETGKTDPAYLETRAGKFPPTYAFSLNWALTGLEPVVKDWTQDGLWNERWYYRELLGLLATRFKSVKARMERSDRASVKSIEAWLKRVSDEEPSNELLGHYVTYHQLINTADDAASAGEDVKAQIDTDFTLAMDDVSARFYKVMNNGQSLLYDVTNDAWTKYEDCVNHYGHKKVSYYDANAGKMVTKNIFNAYREWNSSTRYDSVVFNPRKEGHYDTTFNLWQGFSVKPEAGDEDMMVWDLLRRVCDNNEAYFQYVQKWFAHMVQKPWELPGTCLGISGPQRLGKNALVETFGMLLASQAMIDAINKGKTDGSQPIGSVFSTGGFGLYTSYDSVFGQFNYSTGSKLMLLMDEATWSGSNALKARFKTAITGATIAIADKFVRSNEIANYRRYVLLSNNGDYLAVDPDDGRLLPLEYKAENRPTDEWFDKFYEARRNGKLLANLMHRLLSVDLAGWQPMQALRSLEITTGEALQQASVPDHIHWIEDVAETGSILVPGDKEEHEYRIPICGRPVKEDDLRVSYQYVTNQKGLKGWKKPEFKQLRDAVFGPKKQWRDSGVHVRGRTVPSQEELQARVAATSKWKYKRFDEVELLDKPASPTNQAVLQFKKPLVM